MSTEDPEAARRTAGLALPETLRAAIARDLQAVRPLARPARRVLWVLPIAFLLLIAAVVVFGLRADAPDLGLMLTWIASAFESILGLALVTAALREAVPGTTLSRRAVGASFGTALIAVLTITAMSWSASQTTVAAEFVWHVWRVCVAGTIVSALPALAASGWLAARAFPLRPRLAGALYGVGAGLMADAGWRLFCHYSDPAHVVGAHLLGVVATALIGALLGGWLSRASR